MFWFYNENAFDTTLQPRKEASSSTIAQNSNNERNDIHFLLHNP